MRCKYGGAPRNPKEETWGERCVRKAKEKSQQPEPIDRTQRGFGVFGRLKDKDGSKITVSESSLAFEGAHVRVYVGGSSGAMHLSVPMAQELIDALQLFIDTAESGGCTEPAPEKAAQVEPQACQEDGCSGWTQPATRKGTPWWRCVTCGKIFPFSEAELRQLMIVGTGYLPVEHRYPWEPARVIPMKQISGRDLLVAAGRRPPDAEREDACDKCEFAMNVSHAMPDGSVWCDTCYNENTEPTGG